MLALYIFLIVLLFLAALLLAPTDFGLEYRLDDGESRLTVCLRILLIPIRIPLRVGDGGASGRKQKKKPKKEKKEKKEDAPTPLTWDRLRAMYRGARDAYRATREDTRATLRLLRKRISVKQMTLDVSFGLSDAAKTGITTGAIWAGGTTALSAIDTLFGIRRMEMNVWPDFTQERLKLYIKSIFTVQPVYIIIVAVKAARIVGAYLDAIKPGGDGATPAKEPTKP